MVLYIILLFIIFYYFYNIIFIHTEAQHNIITDANNDLLFVKYSFSAKKKNICIKIKFSGTRIPVRSEQTVGRANYDLRNIVLFSTNLAL